ncbi:hypothetical protein Tco_0759111 [Tanacetum coccineum]
MGASSSEWLPSTRGPGTYVRDGGLGFLLAASREVLRIRIRMTVVYTSIGYLLIGSPKALPRFGSQCSQRYRWTADDADSLGSDLVVSFPSRTRNKIFDPGIFIEVQSKRFLSPNEFSISFIRDPLSPVFDTLLPFSSENEDNVFNPGILASNEEKSSHLLSHRGFKSFQLISESPMMISGWDIPILDVPFLHFYPP